VDKATQQNFKSGNQISYAKTDNISARFVRG
jgi:hypothetical protein